MRRFRDRVEAGQLLAKKLQDFNRGNVVIYALPRGGVVLGAEVAKVLKAPLDLVITRKIGHQFNPEYAICAVAENGELVCNEAERQAADPAWFDREVKKELAEAKRRRQEYLGRESIIPKGKTAIVVDDGIATGLTMQAAIKQIMAQKPQKVIVAVPVSPKETAAKLEVMGAEVVVLDIPTVYLGAVGAYYDYFPQVTDKEVIELLKSIA
jgi:putative phosphoribosyl transferase